MMIKTVQSFAELDAGISLSERSFLLLYKGGTEQSECALKRINGLDQKSHSIFIADVNEVRDIHTRLQVSSAPSLVVFNRRKAINVIKGCLTESAYGSILSGRKIGSVTVGEPTKTRQVTVYTTPTCSWCTTLKTYLKEHQISYREVNVAADQSAAESMVRKSGQQGVPQTEINGQIIVGFDKNRINHLLEIK